jgi:hypothetical protein
MVQLLDAVYDGKELEAKQSTYGHIAARNFENVRPNPGNPTTTTQRLIRADPTCVIAAARRDYASWYVDPKDDRQAFVALVPKVIDHDPLGINATAWSLVFDAGTLDDVAPTAAC